MTLKTICLYFQYRHTSGCSSESSNFTLYYDANKKKKTWLIQQQEWGNLSAY